MEIIIRNVLMPAVTSRVASCIIVIVSVFLSASLFFLFYINFNRIKEVYVDRKNQPVFRISYREMLITPRQDYENAKKISEMKVKTRKKRMKSRMGNISKRCQGNLLVNICLCMSEVSQNISFVIIICKSSAPVFYTREIKVSDNW